MRSNPAAAEPLFELKFGQVGIANLRLRECDPAALQTELAGKVAAAPQLFGRAPLVLDLGHLAQLPDADATQALLEAIRAAGMLPVGLAYGTTENEQLAQTLQLPLFAKFRNAYERAPADTPQNKPATAHVAPAPASDPIQIGMRHDKPVRSGQQVYARGRDLILGATVGNGAEVIADGSIHVYGRLSGRALAGAQGDTSARIYCMDFQAELVSIAGQYRVFDEFPAELRGKPAQAWLQGDKLLLAKL
jgi:septum site-determining protein MinC